MTLAGPDGSRRRARRFTSPPAVIAVVLAVALTVGIVAVVVSSQPSTPLPASPSPTSLRPPSETVAFELFDNFSTPAFDPGRWMVDGEDNVFISSRNGAAHLEAPVQISPPGDKQTLRARLPRPASAVRFQMTLLSVDGPNGGAAYVIIDSGTDRHHKIVMGPSDTGTPVAGYDICAHETGCDDARYDDFEHPVAAPFAVLGRAYEMTVRQSGTTWVFEVDGRQRAVAEREPGPITALSLYLFSSGKPFHATVDDIAVDYAE